MAEPQPSAIPAAIAIVFSAPPISIPVSVRRRRRGGSGNRTARAAPPRDGEVTRRHRGPRRLPSATSRAKVGPERAATRGRAPGTPRRAPPSSASAYRSPPLGPGDEARVGGQVRRRPGRYLPQVMGRNGEDHRRLPGNRPRGRSSAGSPGKRDPGRKARFSLRSRRSAHTSVSCAQRVTDSCRPASIAANAVPTTPPRRATDSFFSPLTVSRPPF